MAKKDKPLATSTQGKWEQFTSRSWGALNPLKNYVAFTNKSDERLGIVLSAILLISTFLPWSTAGGSGVYLYTNIGLVYSWGVVIIILAFAQLVAYVYARTIDLEPATKFRLDFAHAVIGVIALIGVAASQKEISDAWIVDGSQSKYGIVIAGIAAFAVLLFAIIRMVEIRKSGVDLKVTSSAQSMVEKVTEAVQKQTHQAPQVASIADELKKFSDLREQGIITDDQFEVQRNKLLGN